MLSEASNTLLTRVGAGTPMGRLMREYWIPAYLSSEVPQPGSAPLRVMLLGERLIGFRDGEGQPALIAEACPHRGASLFLAANEKCGLRCAYHGWQWDRAGACVDLPGDPTSPLKTKVKAVAYPCLERCGVVWAYLGPRKTPPPLPELEGNMDGIGMPAGAVLQECNWLQVLEGDLDWEHVEHLHRDYLRHQLRVQQLPLDCRRLLAYETADTNAGFAAAACEESSGQERWHIGQFLFPFFGCLPYGASLHSYFVMARVPMDDTHTMSYAFVTRDVVGLPMRLMFGDAPQFVENSADWFGRFRLARNSGNDFGLLPTQGPRARSVRGQAVQDVAVTTTMGPILDRSGEHLARFDAPLIHLRSRMLTALRDFDTNGAPGVDAPAAYRVKQGLLEITPGASWFEALCAHGGAAARQRSAGGSPEMGSHAE